MDRPLTPEQSLIIAMLWRAYLTQDAVEQVTGQTIPWWLSFGSAFFPPHHR